MSWYTEILSKKLLNKVEFIKIISNTSCYGVVWIGNYKAKPIAIKMIMLSSGISNIKKKESKPFIHSEFTNKKSLSMEKLRIEVLALNQMNKLGLAPALYKTFIVTDYGIHYAFVLMELMDHSLKEIFMQRSLNTLEKEIVKKKIKEMHKQGIVHGDMKPSNIGVRLDSNGNIVYINFLDCGKIRMMKDLTSEKFQKLIKFDWSTFNKRKLNYDLINKNLNK